MPRGFFVPTVADVADSLERFAPVATAAEWDNVGLILGEMAAKAERILVCLTITPQVVAEAVREKTDLIVSHHPVLFHGAKKLTDATPEGRLLLPLLKAGIGVYSPHTAFDNCSGGINDTLAESFGLQSIKPLRATEAPGEFKLVVFVPEKEIGAVSEAMFRAGAGRIGNYEQCSFRIPGTGTFFGTDSTNPAIGEKGKLETVQEIRLEVVVPNSKLNAVIAAMRDKHSYEEPAFDAYPLKSKPNGGEGRIGQLAEPKSIAQFAEVVKASCNAHSVSIVGDAAKPIRSVAVACGAAGEFLKDAIRAKADVFVTGEMRFHDLLAAEESGIAVVLTGHYTSERPGIEKLAERLQKEFADAAVWASLVESDPIWFS